MKKYSLSLIVKIPVIVFIAFVIVLGNEMRLGINRYIKNTLKTDAEATKLNLDKFSKSYVETIAMHQVNLQSDKFQRIYRNAIGGDSNKIKCLIDNQGNILDISREGRTEPYLGIVLRKYRDVENLPVYFNLSSLSYDQIEKLEHLLRQYVDGENYVSLTLLGNEDDLNLIDNEIDNVQIKELRINNRVILMNDLQGDTITISGIVNSYENYNVEIYFYNLLRDNLKGTSQSDSKIKSTVIDYDNMIDGLKNNITNHFETFIQNGNDLPPTNSADYFLLKPYEYNGKHYSTIGMRLIDWSRLNQRKSEATSDKEILDELTAGYVLVTQEYENLTMNATKQFMRDNSSTYFIAFVLVGVMSLIVGYSIVMPIRRIETTAKHIARKEFDYPIDMTRHDELGDLSRNINMMSKELEKTINNLYQEVERVQKMEEVRKEFVSNFTHEIKTPLGIINGFSELVELEQDEKKEMSIFILFKMKQKELMNL